MSDIFISHAQSTTALTRRIADALRALGHTVWWDDELPVHQPFGPIIEEQLRAAKAVVVIWSNDAVASTWVPAEAEVARKAGTLLQVSVDGTTPPLPFAQIQYADMTRWNGDRNAPGWRKVVASVTELVGGDRAAATPIAAPDGRTSRIAFGPPKRVAIAALILSVVAVAIWATWYGITAAPRSSPAGSDAGASSEVAPVTNTGLAPDAFANRPAIAVLPFENLSANPTHAIFADGLAADLITRLSAWRAFPVIGRSSSFRYRGDVDIKRVATELNVRYVVQGVVRRDADRIRVTAQLVDAQSGNNVWSQTYDREVAEMFDLQDEISASIAAPLVGDLTRAEANRARQRGTRNADAWSQYQLGEESLYRFTLEDASAARAFYERAIALEPQFASAHAGLSFAYTWERQFGPASSSERKLALALDSARRAVELDPRDATAHDSLAFALLLLHDTPNGLASAQRAVELNSGLPLAWNMLGYAKWLAGDPNGSIVANERTIRLDPYGYLADNSHETLSEAYWTLGQFDAGLKHARILVAAKPDFYWGHVDVALNAVGLGHLDEAKSAIAEARRVQPDLTLASIRRYSGLSDPAIVERHSAALREAGLD